MPLKPIIPSEKALAAQTDAAIRKAHAAGVAVRVERGGVMGDWYPDGRFEPIRSPRQNPRGVRTSTGKRVHDAAAGR